MFCGECGARNLEGRKFCTSCGSPLEQRCAACQAPLDPGDAFCGECGTANPGYSGGTTAASASGPASPLAERRLVSVLFVDLVGFTSYSEGRDAEDVRLLLSDYFQRAEDIVGLYDGVVEKFIGDAVMAVWGTPVAREDDTERAVRAAVELLEAVDALAKSIGTEIKARGGIYTGEAAVNLAAKSQGMVAGDMVNTASRLQSAADPGTILVDRATYLGARDAVAFAEIGPLALKGKEEPVDAWQVLSVVAGRKGFKPGDALEPHFTGRDEEFRLIKDLLHVTARERRPRLASIVGIAGIGKSRLAWELYKYIDGLSEVVRWHQGRSPSYGDGVAFWALSEMVRMRAEIAETDDDERAKAKLTASLAEYVPDAEERRWIEPSLAHLLALTDGSDIDRDSLFAAWRTFFERVAERETTIMVFEDLHWADPGLIDFIEHLMAWVRNSPILIVTLARPELLERRATWGAGQRNFVSVHLEPLGYDDMSLVLKSVAADLPEGLREGIVEQAEGVPLYAVEMLRMLIDRGELVSQDGAYCWVGESEQIDVPDSLHSLIASRLDGLDTPDRLLVQDAAVLGKTFTVDSLRSVAAIDENDVKTRLDGLVRRELFTVDNDPRSPERGQYGFVQSLIREVAYQTLSNETRKDRHLAAAEFFASLGDADMIDVVATHYIEAYRNSRPGPEQESLAERARSTLLEAAQRANSLGSVRQSQALLEKALAVGGTDAQLASIRYQAGLAATSATEYDAATSHLVRAAESAAATGDADLVIRAQSALATAHFLGQRLDEAEAVLTRAIDELDDSDHPAAAHLYAELARIYTFKPDFEKAEAFVNRAMPLAELNEDVEVIAQSLITRAIASIYQSRSHEAYALLRGAVELADEHGLLQVKSRALINMSANRGFVDPRAALKIAREGIDLAQRIGSIDALTYLIGNGCEGAIHVADWDAVEELRVRGEDVPPSQAGLFASSMAIVSALRGDRASADASEASFARLITESSGYQERRGVDAVRCTVAFLLGDLSAAVEVARGGKIFGHEYSALYGTPARAALWLGDVELVEAALDFERKSAMRSAWQRCRVKTIEAGLAAITDRRDDAIRLFEEVLPEWAATGIKLGEAFCRLDMAVLVGGEEGGAAAREVYPFFQDLGNPYLLDKLRAALDSGRAGASADVS